MARSGTLCVLVLLGVCLGIVSGATDSKWREKIIQETRVISKSTPPFPYLSINCKTPPPHNPNPPPPAPTLEPALSPVDHAVPPSHIASPTQPPNSALSPVAVPPSHVAPSPVDAVPPTHSPHLAPSPVDNVVPSPHKAPSSPSPAPSANTVPPPSQSPVVDPPPSRPHPPPSCPPPPPPPKCPPPSCPKPTPSTDCSVVLINVEGCVPGLITFFFKPYRTPISTQCCKVISTISDDCFYSGFTHFRAPLFLGKVRHYCAHHQG